MKLSEIAEKIKAHLARFQDDPVLSKTKEGKGVRFWNTNAEVSGRFVAVTYVSYQLTSKLSKAEALQYLAKLDDGFVGRHIEALREIAADAGALGLSKDELIDAGLQLNQIFPPMRPRAFLQVNKELIPGANFASRDSADAWIMRHRSIMDWRAGYVFRLKGLNQDIAIVDIHGKVLQ